MRNSASLNNRLLQPSLELLKARLPADWQVSVQEQVSAGAWRADAMLKIGAAGGVSASILVELKERINGQQAVSLAQELSAAARAADADAILVIAPYLGEMARKRLSSAGLSYLDLTGNARIVLKSPALFVEGAGANRDPAPIERSVRSLKGAKSARLVRALCDWRPPVGVRELARRTGTDAGYAARVVRFLAEEDLLRRNKAGAVEAVAWAELLKRWAADYEQVRNLRARTFLAARGLDPALAQLAAYRGRYAVTGAFAIPAQARSASARYLSCYAEDPESMIRTLKLKESESGANIRLFEPIDSVVFERGRDADGVACVAVSQCAADLVTGPGREPAEAETLFEWMRQNEGSWRA